jgi:hypothetical protein
MFPFSALPPSKKQMMIAIKNRDKVDVRQLSGIELN